MFSKLKSYLLAIGAAIAGIGYIILNQKVKKAEQQRDELEREYDEYKMTQQLKEAEEKMKIREIQKQIADSSMKRAQVIDEIKKRTEEELKNQVSEKKNEETFTFKS